MKVPEYVQIFDSNDRSLYLSWLGNNRPYFNFINYRFVENENEINLFFDKKTFNLIGWQTVDLYQNVSITYLSSIKRNQKLNKKLFILPKQN